MSPDQCTCNLCGATFADGLAWAAHRPWKSRWLRDKCRWPKALYASAGGWTLRPDAVAEVDRIENGPADEWKARPATHVAPKGQSRLLRELAEKAPSNGAGSRGPSRRINTDRGTLQ